MAHETKRVSLYFTGHAHGQWFYRLSDGYECPTSYKTSSEAKRAGEREFKRRRSSKTPPVGVEAGR